ncbi:MAG TPA: hypothetical protein VIP56_01450 [Nitrososphaeraceae archaeon]|jgi:hypothetical protein
MSSFVAKEHPEKYEWWLNELDSLGIVTKKSNELNDLTEISDLVEGIKQTLFQDYKTNTVIRNIVQPNCH